MWKYMKLAGTRGRKVVGKPSDRRNIRSIIFFKIPTSSLEYMNIILLHINH
jgi:hypothetical protein